jgi:hypothetical protein
MKRRSFVKSGIGAALAADAMLQVSAAADAPEPATSKRHKSMAANPSSTAARRYNHPYHQSLVYKIFLASKPDHVQMTFAETLEAIRQVSEMTAGLRQIVYLVGWQFDGHDSKYPAWSQVNERLKRPEDADARTSLLWLMEKAHQYNAFVSLHINMANAYPNSPLWQEYVDKDLIAKDENGDYLNGGFWGGEQAYYVCAHREWESGLAQDRIDKLLEFLPIAEAGTIHIDIFIATPSPWHKVTVEDSAAAMNKVLDYWFGRGIDVTIEDIDYQFLGRVPMVWHLNVDERSRLMFPPDLLCGGGAAWNARCGDWKRPLHSQPFRPEGGCLYEEAWGYSINKDLVGLQGLPVLGETFFRCTVPWLFLNQGRPVKLTETDEIYEVTFSHGAVTTVHHGRPAIGGTAGSTPTFTMSQGNRILVDGTDLCLPATWLGRDHIAYSKDGGERQWMLPPEWQDARQADVETLYPVPGERWRMEVHDARLVLRLSAGQAVRLTPA